MLGEHNYTTGQQYPQQARHIPNYVSVSDPSIVVQCPRPDLGTRHVQIGVHKQGVSIWYGNLVRTGRRAVFHVAFDNTEFISYDLHPEARHLHDGSAWNVAEISAWVTCQFTDSEDEVEG